MLNYDELVNRDGSINWDKVPVDTPIKVKQRRDSKWVNMCFAKYEYGDVYAWYDGKNELDCKKLSRNAYLELRYTTRHLYAVSI